MVKNKRGHIKHKRAHSKTKRGFRTEKDSLGKKKVPSEAYYGVATQRALDNFVVSGLHFQKSLIYSIALVKKASALAHSKSKELDSTIANAISKAASDVISGKLDGEFKLDVFGAGAGTSENMNMNEVLANRALELLGKKKGKYKLIDPHNHVNLSQSTNDVFHSAIHVAAYSQIIKELLPALSHLQSSLDKKAKSFARVLKSGRTHLRDALPMTLGQEFGAYAYSIKKHIQNIKQDSALLLEINLGGTAIGSSLNASKSYRKHIYQELNKISKAKFYPSKNLFEATSSLRAIVQTHSSLKSLAVDLIKIANDIRFLSSGPATGLNEISLPAVQEGSSIMPGKVNPSMAEMLDMACFQVVGNDSAITMAAEAGQLELNVMMPSAAYSLLLSIEVLSRSVEIFADKCINGITVNKENCLHYLEKNPIIVTALSPAIGYAQAAMFAKKAYKEDRPIKEILLREKVISAADLDKLLKIWI